MKQPPVPEPAVVAGEDPRHYARVLSAVYDAAMSGTKSPARPRNVIGDSWRRLRSAGVDPDQHLTPPAHLEVADLESSRRSSGLAHVVEGVAHGLESILNDSTNILVVANRHGQVLWRSGSTGALGRADGLGFVEGASWAENAVGTNAIGTALVSRRAVQVFSAEHYVRSHHPWTCAGAPIRDPRTGRVLGAIDVSGPAATVHPTTLALVDAIAKLTESQLREQHRQSLDRLRSVVAPMLARMERPAFAVDVHGWVAAVGSTAPQSRIPLPDGMTPGRVWLPSLGMCDVEPLAGGWVLRSVDPAHSGAPTATAVSIDLRHPRGTIVRIRTETGTWAHEPTPRHAEMLYLLATQRGGRTASQLAADLFGDERRVVTVRAEMSRLRKHLSGILLAQPYRFDEAVTVELVPPEDPSMLLPHSSAPVVVNARAAHAIDRDSFGS